MIELIMRSGLGNQMFEYAYTRKIQEKYPDEQIVINTEYMRRYDFRDYSLHHCRLNNRVSVLGDKEAAKELKRFYTAIPFAFGIDFLGWRLLKKQAIGEKKYIKRSKRGMYYAHRASESYRIVKSNRKKKYVFGFFQNANAVEGIEEILRDELEIVTPASKENEEKLREINSNNAVCVHIRRGDYLNEKWKALQVCDFEYYNKAIEEAKKEIKDPVFYVFSTGHDDIEWIKENYHFDANIRYVNLDNPDYEELRLMKACKHFIISNSTFSWWAAFLSKSTEKIVWVPSVWRRDQPEANDIIPNEWRKIEV